jgi:hypothetical protein
MQLQNHVEVCGFCDVQLSKLESTSEPRKLRLPAFLQKPLVPYALLALLLYPAYRGLVGPAKESPGGPAAGNVTATVPRTVGVLPVRSFSLDRVRSDASVHTPPVIHLSDEAGFFLLSFFVPVKASAEYHYDMAVAHGDGTAVVPAQTLKTCDSQGNCSLLCDTALFPAGRYEVRITEVGPGEPRVFALPFEMILDQKVPTSTKGVQ